MSKADKMFKKLGYVELENTYYPFYPVGIISLYGNNEDKRICFWNNKTIEVYDFYDGSREFTKDELKAINKKVKELGWI